MRHALALPALIVALWAVPSALPAQQQPAEPPAEASDAPATATVQALEAAARVGGRFRDSVLGRSLTLALTRTDPELTIHPGDDVAVALERYEGRDDPGFSVGFASSSADLLPIELGDGWFITPFAFNLAANYATFSAQQNLQTTTLGVPAAGEVRGDYLYGAVQISQWLLWEGEWLPGGLHVWNGIGAALLRFEGDLAYSAGGSEYRAQIESDGLPVQYTQTFGLELRLRNVVLSAYGLRVLESGTRGADATLRLGGRELATYTYTFESRAYRLGYVIDL